MAASLAQGALILGLAWVVVRLFRVLFGKSSLDNLRGPPGGSFLAGHLETLFDPDAGWAFHKQITALYGSVIKLRGAFGTEALFVHDAKALHHIFVKDQNIFEETDGFLIGCGLIFGKGLFATTGDAHRKQRKMLNPVFSTAHIRDMTPIFHEVAHKVRDAFVHKVSNGAQQVEVLDWMSRIALELIGQCGHGYSFDPLTPDAEENHYTRGVKRFNTVNSQLNVASQYILPLVHNIGPPKFRRWVVDRFPWKPLREMRDIVDILQSTAEEVVETKRRAMAEGQEAVQKQVGRGKDVISILLRENMKASKEDKLTDEELVGQVSSFTFAAMDTSSNALSRLLYTLSQHPDAQEKLRGEIREAIQECGTDTPSYDVLERLPYLDAVCRETLRLHPPVTTLMRDTREDVVLPFSQPIRGKDGSEMHEVVVPKGTKVFPSLLSSNTNPDIWGPNALEWKPERWLEGLPESVAKARIPGLYSHLMSFIGGGRACIGFKFAELELKVVLCALLSKLRFGPVKGKEIQWKMLGIATPAVCGEPGLQLPLVVSWAE